MIPSDGADVLVQPMVNTAIGFVAGALDTSLIPLDGCHYISFNRQANQFILHSLTVCFCC